MKKTKMQIAKKLNLNKSQITTLTADQADNVAGGQASSRITTNTITMLHLQSNNTHIDTVCNGTRP